MSFTSVVSDGKGGFLETPKPRPRLNSTESNMSVPTPLISPFPDGKEDAYGIDYSDEDEEDDDDENRETLKDPNDDDDDDDGDDENDEEYQKALKKFKKESEEELKKLKNKNKSSDEIDVNTSEMIRRRYSVSTLRRKGLSGESINMDTIENYQTPIIKKTPQEKRRLEKSLANNVLFSQYDKDDLSALYLAMFSKEFKKGDVIIKQGDKGDNFYVVDSGVCDIFVKMPNSDKPKLVKVVRTGDYFGELALMYGTPRAATIIAKTDTKLWGIDRMSYRKIIMGRTMRNRKLYEGFLKKVPLLQSMNDYERLTVADALIPVTFKKGEIVIKQGDKGDEFFIVVHGELLVTKVVDQIEKQLVTLKAGSYFGELALLYNEPRAATITALSTVKCVKLDSKSFRMIMGEIDEILKRNSKNYEFYIRKAI